MKSEFTVSDTYPYNRATVWRWLLSHIWRYPFLVIVAIAGLLNAWIVYSQAQIQIGRAIGEIISPTGESSLLWIALTILALLLTDGISLLISNLAAENVASRLAADARQELYISLLGKSQTFHNRQRVGDIMSRATDDVNQLSSMIVPGATLLIETIFGISVTLISVAFFRAELLFVPLAFVVCYIISLRRYIRRLTPVAFGQREQLGTLNARLEETISGIEVVKASAQESFERSKFRRNARLFRDLFVRQGAIEAGYPALLLFGITVGLSFLHAMLLYQQGRIAIGEIVSFLGLVGMLRFPSFISVFSLSLVQAGIAGAQRILALIRTETDLDENLTGYSQPVRGAITFENVSFRYGGALVLDQISFTIEPGQTVAIVGQTGSGKSSLIQLVNRTYEASEGRVLIDGVDVREWNLTALRSQIAKIEQDVFLFSRSIAENIAFGAPGASREQIVEVACLAQAHDFISGFADGYATVVGERGVTLSGGQRQRIALARAFLNNPRILILDDSTSAVDSATEDQIQQALRRAQQGRTTLLITHRLSQIRWADHILVLDRGKLVARGTHEQLLRRSPHYRRIFARYDVALPPLEVASTTSS